LHDDDEKQESSGSSNTKTDSVVATNETHDLPVPATPSQLPSAPEPVMPSQLPSATDYMKQHQEEEVLLKQRERDAALEAFADRVTRAKQQFIKEVDSIKLGKGEIEVRVTVVDE
jgi:hypothetical protein